LWFAWTNVPVNYDFLPTLPSGVVVPSGWFTSIQHNGIPGDGYSLEMYNLGGSAIGPGQTGTFQFTSSDTPAQLAGDAFIPPNKVGTSFVYIGFPEADPGFQFVAQVPEPATLTLLTVVAVATIVRRRDSKL
jgi:hypothetical protein